MLLASLGSAGVLAWNAYEEASSHRIVAENVLKSYASLVAEEVIRRTSQEVGYYGYSQLALALAAEAQRPGGIGVQTKTNIVSHRDPDVRHAATLIRDIFWIDHDSGKLRFAELTPPLEAVSRLRNQIESGSSDAGYRVFNIVSGGKQDIFVITKTRQGPAGFQVDWNAINSWFKTAVTRRTLLPSSLSRGRILNDSLYVRILDEAGFERLRLGKADRPDLAVKKPFSEINPRVFTGSVETSIDPKVADQLIIGGLPRSRLPALFGLLTITTGLILAAILQLHRETVLQQLRGEFVASVSHELRTPLTQIRMFAETLRLDRIRSVSEGRRYLDIIDREARRLSHLVENVLQFSRSEYNDHELVREARELAPVISEVLANFELLIEGTEVTLTAHLGDGICAMIDCDAIRQVILNLLDNAVKYGPKKQNVLLRLECQNGIARVMVEDEGPGIPTGERQRIFQRFHRLERDRRSAVAGTGIGLSVVKDLVTRLGGRCFVEETPAGGARFIVELPAVMSPELNRA
ncbi:MAG TPA: HAMP domain-containing sensor histidine kinase [Bryobacteraceae bacterium]|nr:HAMP domain-containing sensor histidine kinase [Bryobacteraceae bacterium]